MQAHILQVAVCCAAATALAAGWPTIPPHVWEMKEDPARGIKDAVVMESRTIYQGRYVEYIRRIRILSEAGRKAAEFAAFSEDCYDFEGRTVTHDGKITTFSKKQDFTESTFTTTHGDSKTKAVLAPGLTSNCVVELRWRESGELPARNGNSVTWMFGHPYFTVEETYSLPKTFRLSSLCARSKTLAAEYSTSGGFQHFQMRNIPPFPDEPYSLMVSMDRPRLWIYWIPPDLLRAASEGEQPFWEAAGLRIFNRWFRGGLEEGGHYRTYRKQLLESLPASSPQERARRILAAVRRDIRNMDELTEAELAAWPKDAKVPDSFDLGGIIKAKAGKPLGLAFLLFRLMEDAGCNPKPVLAQDRDRAMIQWKLPSLWQFDRIFLRIEQPGQPPLLLDAYGRLGEPGTIPTDYQEIRALLLEPSNKFIPEVVYIPAQTSGSSRSTYAFRHVLGEDDERFEVEATFSGAADRAERYRYYEMDAAGRTRALKTTWEERLKGASLEKVTLSDPLIPETPMKITVTGLMESEPGSTRKLLPFPGMPSAVWLPDSFPKERTLPIVTSYLRQVEASSDITPPKGHRLVPASSMDHQNSFGKVLWSAREEAGLVKVAFKVETLRMVGTAKEDPQFRQFLAWVDEAQRRLVVFEKVAP